MVAIADADGDGALSFEEVTVIHKRIFDSVDANRDGKVTREEMQAFWPAVGGGGRHQQSRSVLEYDRLKGH